MFEIPFGIANLKSLELERTLPIVLPEILAAGLGYHLAASSATHVESLGSIIGLGLQSCSVSVASHPSGRCSARGDLLIVVKTFGVV